MAKILIVEDDANLCEMVSAQLRNHGFTVDTADDGEAAYQLLTAFPYDLVVLDINLPGLDGFRVCQRFRSAGGSSRILMLTGRNAVEEKERGFDSGADDYLTKPFHPKELLSRVKALLRRPASLSGAQITAGALVLDCEQRHATVCGASLELSAKEFEILELLARNVNRVFSSDALLDRLWSSSTESSVDTVKALIYKLRQKLQCLDGAPKILTIRGAGYFLRIDE